MEFGDIDIVLDVDPELSSFDKMPEAPSSSSHIKYYNNMKYLYDISNDLSKSEHYREEARLKLEEFRKLLNSNNSILHPGDTITSDFIKDNLDMFKYHSCWLSYAFIKANLNENVLNFSENYISKTNCAVSLSEQFTISINKGGKLIVDHLPRKKEQLNSSNIMYDEYNSKTMCAICGCYGYCSEYLTRFDRIYIFANSINLSDVYVQRFIEDIFSLDIRNIEFILPIIMCKSNYSDKIFQFSKNNAEFDNLMFVGYCAYMSYNVIGLRRNKSLEDKSRKWREIITNITNTHQYIQDQTSETLDIDDNRIKIAIRHITYILNNQNHVRTLGIVKIINSAALEFGMVLDINKDCDRKDRNVIDITHSVSMNEYIVMLTNFSTSAYVMSNCASILMSLCNIEFNNARVVPISANHGFIILPPGARLIEKNIYDVVGDMRTIASWIVLSYLLGYNSRYIVATNKFIAPLTYSGLYGIDRARISNLFEEIKWIGMPNVYEKLLSLCIKLYLSMRKYYGVAVMYSDIAHISRNKLMERFCPLSSEEESMALFCEYFSRTADYSLGWKKWLSK